MLSPRGRARCYLWNARVIKYFQAWMTSFSNHCSQARFDVAPLAPAVQRGAGGAPFHPARPRPRALAPRRQDITISILLTPGMSHVIPARACHMLSLERACHVSSRISKYKMVVYGIENDLVHRYFAVFFPGHPEQHLERLRGNGSRLRADENL